MEKKRPQLETKLQIGKLNGKGEHTVKVGNHPHHKYDIKTRNCEKRRAQMQDIGNAFEIKRPAT